MAITELRAPDGSWREINRHEFGLTATPAEHHIWHLDPTRWPTLAPSRPDAEHRHE
ncbi:MAG: hypothetical protein ACRDSF_25055 [Pseudonocardiaceae bacterium]